MYGYLLTQIIFYLNEKLNGTIRTYNDLVHGKFHRKLFIRKKSNCLHTHTYTTHARMYVYIYKYICMYLNIYDHRNSILFLVQKKINKKKSTFEVDQPNERRGIILPRRHERMYII